MVRNLEIELINKCRQGDQNAFRELANNYKHKLFGYCLRMVGSAADAEDVFQNILIKVWLGIKKYNEQQKFSNWLFTIAHNEIQDFFRKRNKLFKDKITDDFSTIISGDNPHSTFVLHEEFFLVMKAVMDLPEKQREVFLLKQQNNITFKEIAVITGAPLNTVLSSMNYAVKKIKKYVEAQYEKR